MQKVDPHREEPLLGRTAHSAKYGETTIHDGSGKPETVNHQEQAFFENFVMGSDAAEFVNKVKDQVRNRQKRMSSIAESCNFVPISWMCKKQTAVSHSSTESEIISLDTGLRLDGLPALELWELIVSVFEHISHISDRTVKPVNGEDKHHKSHNKIDVTRDIDYVPSNVQSSNQEALLYVFEDNEAVIKMIIKGRSPSMRHVSRTHRVVFDCLFDNQFGPQKSKSHTLTPKTNSQTC